jgi:ribosomal protein L37E
MALIKCPDCGNQVSDQAQACIHCGYPLQSATPEPQWEACQIEWSVDKGRYQFWASAVSPVLGTYTAGRSSPFKPWRPSILVTFGQPHYDIPPKGDYEPAITAHRELTNMLVQQGWEPTGINGEAWWQRGFRRKVTSEMEGRLEVDTDLYSRSDKVGLIRRLPKGSTITLVESGGTWMKVRTDRGEIGYVFPPR